MRKTTAHVQHHGDIRSRLKLLYLEEQGKLAERHPHALDFLAKRGISLEGLRNHSSKLLASGALLAGLAINQPVKAQAPSLPPPVFEKLLAEGIVMPENPQEYLLDELKQTLPDKPRPLDSDLEKNIGLTIERATGIRARATLEGEHLNTTYGYIGAEQHLPRFPGDTISQHDQFRESGITPGRGAWGYFTNTKSQLTEDLVQKEKWYAVVQTLYLPDWEERLKYLRDWYKYRKVLIINIENGNAVVADIADSGPASWTGKHFGGSPEVMNSLGGPRYKKGAVILFFVDDPENKIPLGPLEYNRIDKPEVAVET